MALLEQYYDGELTALHTIDDLQLLAQYNYISESTLTGWLTNGQYIIPLADFTRGLEILHRSPKRPVLDRANFRRLVSILDHSSMSDEAVIQVLNDWKDRIDQREYRLPSTYWLRYQTFLWLHQTLGESEEFASWRQRFRFTAQQIHDRLMMFGTPTWIDLINPDGQQPRHMYPGVIDNNQERFLEVARLYNTTPERLARKNFKLLVQGGAWQVINTYVSNPDLHYLVMQYFQEGLISEWSLVQFYWTFTRSFVATPNNVVGLSYLPYPIRYWLTEKLTGDFKGVNVRTIKDYDLTAPHGSTAQVEVMTQLIGTPTLDDDGVEREIERLYHQDPTILTPRTIQKIGRWSIVETLVRLTDGQLPFSSFWRQVHVLHDNTELLMYIHRLAGRPMPNSEDYVTILQHYQTSPRCLKWLLDQGLLVITETTDPPVLRLLSQSVLPPKVGSTGRVIDIFDLYPLAVSLIKHLSPDLRQRIFQDIDPSEMSSLIHQWLTK